MAQQGNIQGVTQVSLLGQLSTALLDQVLRRLRAQAEHVCEFKMHEDVLTRAFHNPAAPLREEDVLRIRGFSSENRTDWSINTLSRPAPIRDNAEVLVRSIASTPIIHGNAGALSVALGYSDRKFAFSRKGYQFTSAAGLTKVQVYQVFVPAEAAEPLDSAYYLLEVLSCTAHMPVLQSEGPPMQTLRENAIQRTLEIKKLLRGLVDLARVE